MNDFRLFSSQKSFSDLPSSVLENKLESPVLLEFHDNTASITINRPQVLNSIDSSTRQILIDSLEKIEKRSDIRCVIISGAGDRAFSTGEDLSQNEWRTVESVQATVFDLSRLYKAVSNIDCPVIASINGYAMGAGLMICLQCDIRIASENAKFSVPVISVGVPAVANFSHLSRILGWGRASHMVLTGEVVDANEAEKIGLVSKVVPQTELRGYCTKLALEISNRPPVAMRLTKRWIRTLMEKYVVGIGVTGEQNRSFLEAYLSGEPQTARSEFLTKKSSKKVES